MDAPRNPHANHRARLRARFLRSGLSDFDAHNVLELLLFYAIARRDTNPIAHDLLSRFKTVDETLSADHGALCGVFGVGDGVARFLRGFDALFLKHKGRGFVNFRKRRVGKTCRTVIVENVRVKTRYGQLCG